MNIILEEIAKGNTKVFKNLFEKHYSELVIYANAYVFNQASSEDIVQEVFLCIWENASTLNVTTSLKGYIYAMVRNKCLSFLKSRKITDNCDYLNVKDELISENTISSNIDPEKDLEYEQLYKTIDSLPYKMQYIVKLKFFHQYKYSEIATELGISINTVKTQLKRAKRKIIESVISVLIFTTIF